MPLHAVSSVYFSTQQTLFRDMETFLFRSTKPNTLVLENETAQRLTGGFKISPAASESLREGENKKAKMKKIEINIYFNNNFSFQMFI